MRDRECRSLWLAEALAEEAPGATAPILEGTIRADVCIVGGGYTGLWTALALKDQDPSIDVALIEADICGGGASGRNGGFVLSWWSKFITLKKLFGAEAALSLATASVDAIDGIRAFCTEHGIDAELRQDGWLWTATTAAQVGAWSETVRCLAQYGQQPFEELPPSKVAHMSGSDAHLAGVYERTGATVQPGRLARGLRSVALRKGVRIFEQSPMVRLNRSRPPSVKTPSGTVHAEVVVLALNAWAANVRELRRFLAVVSSDIVATEAIPHRLRQLGYFDGMCISDSRLIVHYYRTTPAGRLVFGKSMARLAYGGRITGAYHGETPLKAEVTSAMGSIYPTLADVPITQCWTGPVDRPIHGVPAFSELGGRADILYGAGYSGTGVAQSYIGGKVLASLALGRDDEWSRCPLTRGLDGSYPREPFRFIAGSVVRAAVYRRERAEDEGRRVGRVTNWLARFAPAGLVPLEASGETPA